MTSQGTPVPRFNTQSNNLPFTIQYSSFPTSQLSCQNNINSIPNGPIFPSKPIFPSSLPPSLSQYPSNVQTNFINVKREACICTLRTSNLIIDSGFNNGTFLQIKNIPNIDIVDSSKKFFYLITDETGRVFRREIKGKGQANMVDNIKLPDNFDPDKIRLDFEDPVMFDDM